ncbi:MAG: DUF4351 domain-containing protein [Candidatus Accumulibacter sp.]|jgi:hypothetical protein|nr:DUF4351 domain-containing protein [Candidatus Accumulibacter necessarius]
MIIQRFASDGQRFGFIWRRHCGGKNGLSRWVWVCNVVTTVVYFIGNRSAEILIDALPGSLKCYRPTNRYFLLEEASVGEAQLADESNTVGGIIRIEKSGTPADIRRAVARLHQRLQGAQYDSPRRALVGWINRVVLRRLMPGQAIPEVNELQEIDAMLAEAVDSWTRQWKEEGGLEGESTLLQKLFERRFGPLPEWARQRLAEATGEQLEAWALEVLDADTLEGVFEKR